MLRRGDRLITESKNQFLADAAGESIAPLLFDVDGDGDIDLFIARGSYQFSATSPLQQDLLYLNDGKGNFSPAPGGSIPAARSVSGHSCIADYNRDGDLDLFIASRVTPGEYPIAPASRLLINDSTPGRIRFDEQAIPDLGMVTSAIWTDADGDGWIDLLVATEWGTLKLLKNQQGTLANVTTGTGLEKYSGWWNSLTACDIDLDGDLDYLAGNLGLNSKYHPTTEKPALLFTGIWMAADPRVSSRPNRSRTGTSRYRYAGAAEPARPCPPCESSSKPTMHSPVPTSTLSTVSASTPRCA